MKDQFMMASVPDEGSVNDGNLPDEGSVHGGECT